MFGRNRYGNEKKCLSQRFILSIRSLLLWTRFLILNDIPIHLMLPPGAKPSLTLLIVLLAVQLNQIDCLLDDCLINADCPSNAYCGQRGLCVCEPGFILNCSTSALTLSGIPITAAVSPVETYYIIEPQVLYEFLKFQVQVTTT